MAKEHLYEQIADEIRTGIIQNKYIPGQQLPSELVLAKNYSVSRITSRKAIDLLVEQNLVRRARGSGTFVVDTLPSVALNNSRDPLISFILPFDNSSGTLIELIDALSEDLSKQGFFVSIHNSHWDYSKERELLLNILDSNVDGLVLFPISSRRNLDVICQLSVSTLPFVVLDTCYDNLSVNCVSSNNIAGAEEVTKYMIKQGHKKMAFISYDYLDFNTTLRDRYLGFCKAHRELNIPLNPENNFIGFRDKLADDQPQFKTHLSLGKGNEVYRKELVRILYQILQSGITAVLAEHDTLALDLMLAAKENSIKIPEAISIAGFDDIPILSRLGISLTTVHQDFKAIALEASSILVRIIRTRKRPIPYFRILDTHLVERDSVSTLSQG